MQTSEQIIETMIASLSDETTEQDRRAFKIVLRQLVRIAQAEQLQAIENDFDTVYQVLRNR